MTTTTICIIIFTIALAASISAPIIQTTNIIINEQFTAELTQQPQTWEPEPEVTYEEWQYINECLTEYEQINYELDEAQLLLLHLDPNSVEYDEQLNLIEELQLDFYDSINHL